MEKRGSFSSLLWVLTALLVVWGRGADGRTSSGVTSSGVSGSGSGVSGSGIPGCVSAGFCTCCVPTTDQSCVINSGEMDMCSCDVGCFENDTCCFDITEVPCLPDIFVEFFPQTYTVTEGTDNYVNVTVRASGFPGPSFDVYDITVLLTTESGTAEAGTDFDGVIRNLRFSSDGEWVVQIPILDNSPVELTEYFSVNLATTNPFVVFNNNMSTVEIRDDDVLTVELDEPEDTPESNGTAQVCVSVLSGVLQSGLEVVVSVGSSPVDPEDAADFESGPLTVTLTSGDALQCVNFAIRMDNLIEGDETFSLHIGINAFGLMVTAQTIYRTIVILDSTVGTITLEAPASMVEEGDVVEICAVIGGAQLERDVVVMIETTPITATEPADYAGGVFNLTFQQPSTRECLNISIAADNIFEDDESFSVAVVSDDPAIEPGSPTNIIIIILDETEIPFDFVNDISGVYLVQESTNVVTVCVGVTGGTLDREVVLMLNTSELTALAEIDYVSAAIELTFNASQTQVCTDITLIQELVVENPEEFRVILSSSDPEVVFVRDEATVNVIDSTQFELGFVPVNYAVEESSGSAVVCVNQTSFPTVEFDRTVPLTFDTVNGVASAPADFDAVVNEGILFPSTSCITITINDDAVIEPDESFTVEVDTTDPAVVLGDSVATVTIVDAEAPVGIELAVYSVGEADGTVEVCVVAIGFLSQDVQLMLLSDATSGTATNIDDYFPVSEPLTLLAGSNPRVCANVTINDDVIDEISQESFEIQMTLLSPFPVFRNSTYVVIIDDDEVEVGFSPQQYTVREGINSNVTVCVSLSGPLERDGVIVRVATADMTALSGFDYTSLNETLVFNSGDKEMCVDIDILDDSGVEQTETFYVNLESVSGEGIFNSPAMVFILDNDEDFVFVFGNIPVAGSYFFAESGGFVTVCVTETTGTLSREVIVTLNTSDVTAISPDDYTSTSVDLVFNATTTEVCTDIPLLEDLLVENVEEFTVGLSSDDPAVSFPMDQARVILVDTTTFELGFVPVNYAVQESSGSAVVCVNQTSFPTVEFDRTVPLTFDTVNGVASAPADFDAVVNEGILFPSTSCITITINDDAVIEPDESFTVEVDTTDPAVVLGDSVATVTIDAEAPVGIELAVYSVGEADGTVEVCVVAIGLLSRDIQFSLTSQDITATAGTNGDYEEVSETLTLPAGSNPSTCVMVVINDDMADENSESFRINLDVLTTPWPTFRTTATVEIIDNDVVQVGFDPEQYNVTEGTDDFVTVCVGLDRPLERDGVRVEVSTADDSAMAGADYTSLTQTLVFNSGDPQMCVEIDITDDAVPEPTPETFFVNLQSLSGEPVGASQAIVTIFSNDEDPPIFGFENPELLVFIEDAGTVQVCVVLESGTVSQSTIVTVTSGQPGDTATADEDYSSVSESLEFTPGTSQLCVDLVITDNVIGEDTETLTLTLSTGPSATVTIIDNDPVEFAFDPNAYTVDEGQDLMVFVVANREFENGPFTVNVRSQDGTALSDGGSPDFTAINEDLIFNDNTPMTLTISTNSDSLVEGDEQFTLILTNILTGAVDTATVTIEDVVVAPGVPSIGLELSSYSVSEEDEAVRVCVSLTQEVSFTVTATISTADGTAMAGLDYVPLSVNLEFPGDDIRECVEIDLIDDTMGEPAESFIVQLTSNDLPVFRPMSTINILQDQDGQLIVTLQEPIMAVDEGVSTFPVCVDFIGSNLNREAVVTLSTTQTGTALGDVDYTIESMDITYFPVIEQVIICEDVSITDDNLNEEIELFGVTLTSLDGAVIFTISSGVIIIADNDNPTLSAGFVQTDIRQPETDGLTSARLRTFVNGLITQPITLTVSVTGGTATVGDDFIDEMAVFEFNTNADNPRRAFYTIIGDGVEEPDETIVFGLSEPSGVSLVSDRSTAVVNIINDDMIPTETGIIVLVDNTPEVMLESGAGTVRVQFTLTFDATSVSCFLRDIATSRQDCTSGTYVVTGLPTDRSTPLTLEITALNQLGQQVAFLSRNVRLGLNGDCSVNYLNGVEEALVFQGDVFISFSSVGPTDSTDCQLDGGTFIQCTSPMQYENLSLGEHSVKVRPNGSSCLRRIRRTVIFNVV